MFTLALLAAGCASGSPAPIAYRVDAPQDAPVSEPARGPEERPTQRAEIEYRNAGPAPPSRRERQTEGLRAQGLATAPAHQPDWDDSDGAPLSADVPRQEEALPATQRASESESESESESLYDIATLARAPASDTPLDVSTNTPAATDLAGARFQMPLDGAVTARFGVQP
ncbi:MAG: hypothetical protein ACREH4_08915, partial [Vitreimonas sp.]